jgi:hypothetical protein
MIIARRSGGVLKSSPLAAQLEHGRVLNQIS